VDGGWRYCSNESLIYKINPASIVAVVVQKHSHIVTVINVQKMTFQQPAILSPFGTCVSAATYLTKQMHTSTTSIMI